MKRNRLTVIFLFFALTLMACNLTSMLPGNDEEIETTVEATQETTIDSPTEEPMEESEVIEEPTPKPESDSMNSSESSTSTSSGQQSACDHPYFPMREGATWVYYDEGDVYYYHWDIESVSGDAKNATAIMKVYINEFSEPTEEQKEAGTQIEYNWLCSRF